MFYNKTIPSVIGKKETAKFLNQEELHFIDLSKEIINSDYIEAVQVYIDHVKNSASEMKDPLLLIEESYSLEDYVNDDCGGSADATLLEKKKKLQVNDYKHGEGVVVEALSNPQNRLYGLGALLKYHKEYQFEEVELVIIQPRVFHADGSIRSETLTPNELKRWGRQVVKPAVKLLNSDNPELTPGENQCLWCRVNGICEANAEQSLMIAQKDFAEIELPDDEFKAPEFLTKEQINIVLNNKKRMEKWLNAVLAFAEDQTEQDRLDLDDYKLVEKISNRRYRNEKGIIRRLKRLHENVNPYEPNKLRSPAQMEIYLKSELGYKAKDAKTLVDQFCERVKTGVALAPITDGRKQIEAPIKTEFKNDITGGEEDDVNNFYS